MAQVAPTSNLAGMAGTGVPSSCNLLLSSAAQPS